MAVSYSTVELIICCSVQWRATLTNGLVRRTDRLQARKWPCSLTTSICQLSTNGETRLNVTVVDFFHCFNHFLKSTSHSRVKRMLALSLPLYLPSIVLLIKLPPLKRGLYEMAISICWSVRLFVCLLPEMLQQHAAATTGVPHVSPSVKNSPSVKFMLAGGVYSCHVESINASHLFSGSQTERCIAEVFIKF